MGIDKLIAISATLAVFAIASGELPKILKEVRIAELRLLKESQAIKWGMPMVPPSR